MNKSWLHLTQVHGLISEDLKYNTPAERATLSYFKVAIVPFKFECFNSHSWWAFEKEHWKRIGNKMKENQPYRFGKTKLATGFLFWDANYAFKPHNTFPPVLLSLTSILFTVCSSLPSLTFFFQSPPQTHSIFSKLSCNGGLQSGRELLWGCQSSRLSFPQRRGFSHCRVCCWYSAGLHLDHAAPGLFTRQAGDRGRGVGMGIVSLLLLFRPLATFSRHPEPIPPQRLGDKLNMIRRHRTGLESRGRGSHQDVASAPFLICMEIRSQTARTANKVAVWET